MNLLAAALVLATVATVPIRVGIHIPNSVTISIPSVMTMPTATPMPSPAPGAPGSLPEARGLAGAGRHPRPLDDPRDSE